MRRQALRIVIKEREARQSWGTTRLKLAEMAFNSWRNSR